MSPTIARNLPYIVAAAIVFALAVLQAQADIGALRNPAVYSGYGLIALMLFLGLFNVRKKLAMLPLGRAAVWLRLHAFGGLLALAIYWLHTRSLWPSGFYEQLLAGAFYLVSATGIIGYVLQRAYPKLLTQSGIEVIYERIPAEIAALREAAEAEVLECTRETGSETLARHYLETFDEFFRRPRNFFSHLFGGRKGAHWISLQVANLTRYLNDNERAHLERLTRLAHDKNRVDYHYTAQTVMKTWLMVHLPLSVSVLALAVWHMILVHVYAI